MKTAPALLPDNWPACWLFAIRSDVAIQGTEAKTPTYQLGERTTVDRNGALTYRCSCGSSFTRVPGFEILEARAWVVEHAPHIDVVLALKAAT